MRNYLLSKYPVILILLLSGLQGVSQNPVNIRRVCNEDDPTSYNVLVELLNACDGVVNEVNVYGMVRGSANGFETMATNVPVSGGYNNELIVTGKADIEWIYVEGNVACLGQGSISDTIVVDREEPDDIRIRYVSIENGKVYVRWEGGTEADIAGYELYRVDEQSTSIPVGEVRDKTLRGDTLYWLNPDSANIIVRIAAIDSCGRKRKPDGTSSTIHLEVERDDLCENVVDLSWNNYDGTGWRTEWQIIRAVNESGITVYVDTIENFTGEHTIRDLPEGEFEIWINERNLNNGDVSRSNRVEVRRLNSFVLDTFLVRGIDVVNGKETRIKWTVQENSSLLSAYKVWRREWNGKEKLISNVDHTTGELDYEVKDEWTGGVNEYYVEAIGVCAGSVFTENEHNILLRGNMRDTSRRDLYWNHVLWQERSGVVYQIESKVNGSWDSIDVTFDSFYTDNTTRRRIDSGYCYRVRALGNEKDVELNALSSEQCLFLDFHGDFANGFTPEGDVNRVYRVKGIHFNDSASTLEVYNRWGQRVLRTNFPKDEGWDGTIENEGSKDCPSGVYVFRVELVMLDGSSSFYQGSIRLIR